MVVGECHRNSEVQWGLASRSSDSSTSSGSAVAVGGVGGLAILANRGLLIKIVVYNPFSGGRKREQI